MRVLVVSEDPIERLRATSALTLHAGAEVVEVDSGEEARRQLRAGEVTPDVLVLDGDLQPRGGFALLYDLHQQQLLTGAPVPPTVVLISRVQDQFLVDWSQADAELLKPVDPFALARTVGELSGSVVAVPVATIGDA